MTKELFDWTERFIAGPHTTMGEAEKLTRLLGMAKTNGGVVASQTATAPPVGLAHSCCLSVSRDRREDTSFVRLDFDYHAEANAVFEWLDEVVATMQAKMA